MAQLPTTDAPAKAINQGAVDLINFGVPLAEAAIIAQLPVMGTPIWCSLWESVFKYFADQLAKALGTVSAYIVMDVQSYLDLKNAAVTLIKLQAAQKSGDADALAKANADMDSAVAPILHYHGDART